MPQNDGFEKGNQVDIDDEFEDIEEERFCEYGTLVSEQYRERTKVFFESKWLVKRI